MNRSIMVESTDRETLVADIAAEVMRQIKPLLVHQVAPPPAPSRRMVDAREMARIISVSESTLARLVASGRVPSAKVGSSRRFDVDAVVAALAESPDDRLPGGVQHISEPIEAVLDRYGLGGSHE